MQRLERPLDMIYERFNCWGEIHSIECFRERWDQIQRLFFSSSSTQEKSSKHYVIFSHGNLLSSLITFLTSGGSWNSWNFGNIAPHCSVSVLSYKSGDALPQIVFTPFQISNRTLPKTINNVNPTKMRLKEIMTTGIINEQIWQRIINSVIPVSQ
jgi:broad specificity phosphatase PhoE